ncbi:carboxypeptidase-like regulatory domain-containing protein [Hymenobacter sp. ASUV-10]|uniref:Carboxypeptidase-like regulatory domain-containing protein n=1 Tax=Hymenobacter aranciens TaxID=3063996 RepID=A0ABT9BH50_9BACT|nr:carboxypeptidase-like regulatory domain-containing protein [Hymenobacter sp. ASUV-10]MDO7877120.1 carboxypeptidase-like regulatory domain-containing protein [Hymenobacter sp. ASUV-10]
MKTTTFFLLLGLSFCSLPGRATPPTAPTDTLLTAAPGRVFFGTVRGPQGALPGATVWLAHTRTIAVADANGQFALPLPEGLSQVEVTCAYAGLEAEVLTLDANAPAPTLQLLRPAPVAPAHLGTNLRTPYELLKQRVQRVTK